VVTTDVRARRREATRREILDAAWRLAAEQGLANLSLRDVAAEVGMRAPSLYTYFDSKGSMLDAMFAQGYRELDELYAGVRSDGDLAAMLTAATEAFVRFCQASVPRYQLMFTRAVAGWEPSARAYEVSVASYEHMRDRLAAAGVQGQRALDLWTAMTAGLAAQQLANDPDGDRWFVLSRDVAVMFVDHLRRNR